MASVWLSTTPTWKPLSLLPPPTRRHGCSFHAATPFGSSPRSVQPLVVYNFYRHHLDTPIELEEPRTPRRPSVFRPLGPMTTPVPPILLPYDPIEEDEFAEGYIDDRAKINSLKKKKKKY